jgi:hypothetical protein
LNELEHYDKSKSYQVLNSIYAIYLLADALPTFDTSEITKPLSESSKINLISVCTEFREFLKKFPLTPIVDVGSKLQNDQLLKLSGSAGPNTSNAQTSALADAFALRGSNV